MQKRNISMKPKFAVYNIILVIFDSIIVVVVFISVAVQQLLYAKIFLDVTINFDVCSLCRMRECLKQVCRCE